MSASDPPDDIDSEAWEAWATEVVDGTGFDVELGVGLARDAQRVARGEMTEAEYQDKYHEAVLDEFGVDDRPTAPEPQKADGSPLPGVPGTGNGKRSRRSMLKTAGAIGLGTLGLSAAQQSTRTVAAQSGDGDSEPDVQMGMAINTDRCIACLQCMDACNEENGNPAESLWMAVLRYQEDDYTDNEEFLTRPCQHCSDAPCETACPTNARYTREEDGIVLTDYDQFTGCRYCEVSCPYGVNYMEWAEPGGGDFEADRDVDGVTAAGSAPQGTMGKCTFCAHRQVSDDESLQGTTACEDVCPVDAIHFGDMNDEESAPRQHLANDTGGQPTYRLLEDKGTDPNIVYVGNEPSRTATQTDGPTGENEFDLVRERHGRREIEIGSHEDDD